MRLWPDLTRKYRVIYDAQCSEHLDAEMLWLHESPLFSEPVSDNGNDQHVAKCSRLFKMLKVAVVQPIKDAVAKDKFHDLTGVVRASATDHPAFSLVQIFCFLSPYLRAQSSIHKVSPLNVIQRVMLLLTHCSRLDAHLQLSGE